MTSKLVSTSREGDFVHASQHMSSQEGFRNVSRRWLERGTLSYEQGLAALEAGRAETEDLLATVAEMAPAVDDGGHFVLRHVDGRSFRPTAHAIMQMGEWARTGSWYIQSLLSNPTDGHGEQLFSRDRGDAETLAQVLRNGFRRLDQAKKFLWRTRQDGTLRAMLSEQYARVDNRWFLETLRDLVPGGRLSHWRGDQDTIFGNVLIPDTIRADTDSDYGGMLSVGNSEIGERRITSLPSIFRAICQNGCIWGRKTGLGICLVHRGKINLQHLRTQFEKNLQAQIPLLPQGITRLLGLRNYGWDGASMLPLFAQVASQYRLSRQQASSLLSSHADEQRVAPQTSRSLFGVVAAITRASQKMSNADWVRLDTLGGELSELGRDGWDELTSRASRLRASEVEATFAQAV